MSNKTSDKNVANEERLNNFIEAYKQTKEQSFIVDSINKDFFFEFVDCLLAELEQKDKRIQELEEERDHWHGCFIVAMENSIAKEKVINVMQEYKDKIERYKEYRIQGKETDVEYYENIANTIIVQVLQELLGEESQ